MEIAGIGPVESALAGAFIGAAAVALLCWLGLCVQRWRAAAQKRELSHRRDVRGSAD